MGRIWDKRKMKEKKKREGAEKRRRMAQPGSAKCARRAYARKEEGKSEEREITREEVYRDLWRVSIGSKYRKVVGRLSGRYGDRDKCSLKGPAKERSGAAIHHRQIAEPRYKDETCDDWIDAMRKIQNIHRVSFKLREAVRATFRINGK